jgi:predicted dehydrogenase
MRPLRIAILGFGKIAADQHVPAIEAHPRLQLVASSSRSGAGPEPCFTDYRELQKSVQDLDAVAITTPPEPRYEIAKDCIAAGLQALLEKPPTATLGEIEHLACLAESAGITLFTTWHAQHNPAVTAAAELLAGKAISQMAITWHEDVRKWHPGQQWVWRAGGFGVFDPGINAFSIATRIFPGSLFVDSAELSFPEGADTPVAAEICFSSTASAGPLTCSLDWRRSEGEEWTIAVHTGDGEEIRLERGGARLVVNGEPRISEGPGEYPDIYRQFVDLVDERRSSVDIAPLRLVADCLLVGSRKQVPAVIN